MWPEGQGGIEPNPQVLVRGNVLQRGVTKSHGPLVFGLGVIVVTFHGVGGDLTFSDILKMVRSSALPVAPR